MHRGGYNEFQQMHSKRPKYTGESQSCFYYRINKPFACSRCVICVSRSAHLNSTYYARKGSWAFLILITHKSMRSENPITWYSIQRENLVQVFTFHDAFVVLSVCLFVCFLALDLLFSLFRSMTAANNCAGKTWCSSQIIKLWNVCTLGSNHLSRLKLCWKLVPTFPRMTPKPRFHPVNPTGSPLICFEMWFCEFWWVHFYYGQAFYGTLFPLNKQPTAKILQLFKLGVQRWFWVLVVNLDKAVLFPWN